MKNKTLWTQEKFDALTDSELVANFDDILTALKENRGRLPSENQSKLLSAFNLSLRAKTPEEMESANAALSQILETQKAGG
jgi:hypothetical protein